jgi:succinylglutamate desuccinylase
MNIALIGGTHGNEPIGREVVNLIEQKNKTYKNNCDIFYANPKAYEIGKRYVDSDLNRSFGKNKNTSGYEQERSLELTSLIKGKFDFSIDLHTTTSNMGQTAILNNTHKETRRVATYLKQIFPSLILIEETNLDNECNHLNRLCPAGLTIELGPVANNVIEFDILKKMFLIVESILDFDFTKDIDTTKTEYFKMLGKINFPQEPHWYIDSKVDRHDFIPIKPGQTIFVNIDGQNIKYEGLKEIFPFFVNEAAYLENRSAFLYAEKKVGFY